ncbi:ABC transporter substrate-binding protein [Saccharibacillus sp. JS10]|uniref:ABC transporter substrate-binding protein n=1 Tax=Saccharibacillus sp. JS10 TaxID=2950552 RepID=UPI00210BAB8F|nr:ABC transporter substrate-binding protein [Saccharibacillus sp. JS10]MCQ4087272.1 ABC transporter substrate-binding protein [Saccharibacillus sp. JS10]
MRKKSLFYAFSLLSISFILILTACTPQSRSASGTPTAVSGESEKVTLDFWTFWGSETRRPIIEKIIEDFNQSQDRITVKHTYLPFGDIWTKNLASIAAGNPADVIINDYADVNLRASKNQNTDLSTYLAENNIENRFYPELWKNVLYEDKAYALPFNTDTRLLYYNKKAFQEAGLDPEQPPQTWAELEEYAQKLDKKSANGYDQVGFYPLWGDFGVDSWLINGDNGNGYFNENNEAVINTPDKAYTLTWLKSWQDRLGKQTVDAMKADFGSGVSDPFISGKVAMYIQTGTYNTQIQEFGQDLDIGVAQIPEREAGSGHFSSGGGFVVEIPKGAKHPDEAWEFINYLTDVDAQKYWAIKNFDNVANIEAAEDPEANENAIYKASVDNLADTKVFQVPLSASGYKDLINPHMDAVFLGQETPEQALAAAEKDVQALIEKNK